MYKFLVELKKIHFDKSHGNLKPRNLEFETNADEFVVRIKDRLEAEETKDGGYGEDIWKTPATTDQYKAPEVLL